MATAAAAGSMSSRRLGVSTLLMILLLQLGVLLQLLQAAAATKYTVSWNYPNYENYFSNWNKGTTYVAGDSIEFLYNAEAHNVVKVNNEQYNACSSNAQPTDSNGDTVFALDQPGMYFFMCTVPGHCQAGMKLAVQVI